MIQSFTGIFIFNGIPIEICRSLSRSLSDFDIHNLIACIVHWQTITWRFHWADNSIYFFLINPINHGETQTINPFKMLKWSQFVREKNMNNFSLKKWTNDCVSAMITGENNRLKRDWTKKMAWNSYDRLWFNYRFSVRTCALIEFHAWQHQQIAIYIWLCISLSLPLRPLLITMLLLS